MFKIAKAISKKTNKNYFLIVLDIIRCGIKYQAGYYDYQEFEFYNLNNKERKTYLTRGKNNQIIRKFNDKSSFHKFDNKIELNTIFNDFLKRNWMMIDDNNFSEFQNFFKKNKAIIVKPIDESGGNGIEKFVYSEDIDCKELYEKLLNNKQFLIEECLKQHPKMNELYDKSVNTMRMFTFLKNGVPYFLQAVLKIGNGGIVDNFSSGGMYTYVDDTGYVYVEALDRADNIYSVHPISNHKIVGFKVPMFKEAIKMVKEAAKVVPEIAYVGWDVAITANGPALIEGNSYPGIFQAKPSLLEKKEGLIPKYNKEMKIF